MSSSITHHRHGTHRGIPQNRSGFTRTRSGFTLTELLIVITIIGLLVGMLAVAGGRVITTAREFAVTTEITQMSQAIESFKTEYGFYPPSFEQFRRQVDPSATAPPIADIRFETNQLLPYLIQIPPNHQELSASPIASRASAGYRRIDDWWQNVGVKLDQQTSLQFWLSGLAHNKQFPLTGGLAPASASAPYVPVGYNAPYLAGSAHVSENVAPPETGLARKVFYDFDQDRFAKAFNADGTEKLSVSAYDMAHGKSNGDKMYLYRDSGSYLPAVFNSSGTQIPLDRFDASQPSLAYHFWDGMSAVTKESFANPNTFQLISLGLDGDAGIMNPDTGVEIDPQFRGDLNSQLPKSDDNLCNFADGRLDKFITDKQ